jgi:hypothetical protein
VGAKAADGPPDRARKRGRLAQNYLSAIALIAVGVGVGDPGPCRRFLLGREGYVAGRGLLDRHSARKTQPDPNSLVHRLVGAAFDSIDKHKTG